MRRAGEARDWGVLERSTPKGAQRSLRGCSGGRMPGSLRDAAL